MRILFLLLGPVSFKASSFIRSFIKQLDLQEYSIHIMSEKYSFMYLQVYKNLSIKIMDENFSKDHLESYLNANSFDLVLLVNIDVLLFDESKCIFKKTFFPLFKNIQQMFLVTGNHLSFDKNSVSLTGVNNSKLSISPDYYLLKSCPPYIPEDEPFSNKGTKTFYWKNLEMFAFLNKDESRMKLKKRIKSEEHFKTVTLYLDIESTFLSESLGLFSHYDTLVECVYKYLSNLDTEINLVVTNLPYLKIKETSPKVKISYMGYISDEENEMVVRASDLIITESIASTFLIDAANLKIPVVVLNNSLTFERVKDNEEEFIDLKFSFKELTDFSSNKVSDLIDSNPNSIFKYYAFPNKAHIQPKEELKKVFGYYIFTFSELFDEVSTTNLFKGLLLNTDVRKEEVYRIEQYLALRSDAYEAQEIFEMLNPEAEVYEDE